MGVTEAAMGMTRVGRKRPHGDETSEGMIKVWNKFSC